jgi:uncharacterized protein involved in exopolysaccharide biosynthesis
MVEVEELSLIDSFYRLYRRWWWIALLAILGGSLGWAFQRIQPPVYETKAVFSVQIDFTQTGPLNEFEQDYAIGIPKLLMLSPAVTDQVYAQAHQAGISADELEYGRRVFIERRQYIQELRVWNEDPEKAALIANLWLQVGLETVRQAQEHAWRAQALWSYLRGLEGCGEEATRSELCAQTSPEEIRGEIEQVLGEIEQETQASRGILPALMVDLVQPAEVPGEPRAYRTNILVLSGTLVGLLLGVLVVQGAGRKQ